MTPDGQRVCLSMIVKNEAAVLPRCLASVRPWIDSYAIVDTGSTDDTIEVIKRELEGIPGAVKSMPHHRSWLDRQLGRNHFDFAKHRNAALDLAKDRLRVARTVGVPNRKSGYILLIDADEEFTVTNGAPTWPTLTHDRYVADFRVCETGDGRVWHRTLLVKASHPWRYRWPIHESLDSDDESATAGIIAGVEVRSYSDGARNQDKVAKYLNDASALRAAIQDDPTEPRHWFYLGQSLAGAGRFREAMNAYEKRVEMQRGWDEEWWYALYQLAPLKELLGYRWTDVRDAYLRAWAKRPQRAEPLWAAGILSVDHGEPEVGELLLRQAAALPRPRDSFLLDESIYTWRALDDLSGALAAQGRAADCLDVLEVLKSRPLPKEHAERIEENIDKANAEKAAA